jgi:hypothetical protein
LTRRPDVLGNAHRRLSATGSIPALLAAVELFLQELPPARLAEISPDCRPRRIETQRDITHWARRLNRHRMLGAQGTRSRGFRVVLDFFEHAQAQAQRLRSRYDLDTQVVMPRRAEPPGPRPSDRRPS